MTTHMTLDELQRRMLAAITDPACMPCARLEELILPTSNQTSAERLGVYGRAYFARLIEVMRELFPCFRHAVGSEVFDGFALEYLTAYPPRSYTLSRLADHFVEHLRQTQPREAPWGGFLIDLARLEQAIDETFDGPGPEEFSPLQLPSADKLCGDIRLPLVPGFRMLEFGFPVSSYYTAWKAETADSWPDEQQQFVALLRRDYIVRRYELSQPQFKLLAALHRGETLGAALEKMAVSENHSEDLPSLIQQWFTKWAAERFFAGFTTVGQFPAATVF